MRRLRVTSLENLTAGQNVPLPETEAHHVRVLRLKPGSTVELCDQAGRRASGLLCDEGGCLEVRLTEAPRLEQSSRWLSLAVAWPKGKRAALLVEKCSELGVDCIFPVRYARSVVTKDDDSEGLVRLRRIAAEAAKQCGRSTLPEIQPQAPLAEVLRAETPAVSVVLVPDALRWLPQVLDELRPELTVRPLTLFIGPEGGFSPEELAAFERAGVKSARLAPHVLRIETAALAACALAQAWRGGTAEDAG